MKNSEQPAFASTPIKSELRTDSDAIYDYCQGLTKREYIATKAMQGMLANSKEVWSDEAIIRDSVKCADALLNELEKPQSNEKQTAK